MLAAESLPAAPGCPVDPTRPRPVISTPPPYHPRHRYPSLSPPPFAHNAPAEPAPAAPYGSRDAPVPTTPVGTSAAGAVAQRPAAQTDAVASSPSPNSGGPPGRHVATLVAMTVDPLMTLRDVKNHLSEVVDQVEREHDRIVITKHGRPAAVVLSIADLESLEETLDVMGRPKLLSHIRDSLAELQSGPAQVLTKEQARQLLAG